MQSARNAGGPVHQTPLIFRHGAATAAFNAAVVAWLVFEFVMRMRQRKRLVPRGVVRPGPSLPPVQVVDRGPFVVASYDVESRLGATVSQVRRVGVTCLPG